jgi:hypothetical protein
MTTDGSFDETKDDEEKEELERKNPMLTLLMKKRTEMHKI